MRRSQASGQAERAEHRRLLEGGDVDQAVVVEAQHGEREREERGLAGTAMAHSGARFVQALSRLSLIDEYRLVILPVALGNGLPLFKDLAEPLRLDLAEAKSFPDGTVIHVYQPIRTPW